MSQIHYHELLLTILKSFLIVPAQVRKADDTFDNGTEIETESGDLDDIGQEVEINVKKKRIGL